MEGSEDVEHPVRRVTFRQGRTLTWVARQLGISPNYLHRVLLPLGHPDHRPPPEHFYSRLSQLLGVPEDMLKPAVGEEEEQGDRGAGDRESDLGRIAPDPGLVRAF